MTKKVLSKCEAKEEINSKRARIKHPKYTYTDSVCQPHDMYNSSKIAV